MRQHKQRPIRQPICETCQDDHALPCAVLAVEHDTEQTENYVPCECDCGGGQAAWAKP